MARLGDCATTRQAPPLLMSRGAPLAPLLPPRGRKAAAETLRDRPVARRVPHVRLARTSGRMALVEKLGDRGLTQRAPPSPLVPPPGSTAVEKLGDRRWTRSVR